MVHPTTDPSVVHVMDVGGGHVTAAAVALTDDRADVLRRSDRALDSSGSAEVILGAMADAGIGARRTDPTVPSPERWAVAMPGPFDYDAGVGTFAGVGKFAAIAGLDLRAALAHRLDVASLAVAFCNDAVAYGIGEWAFGAGSRSGRMLCVTLGTGIGSAFLADGVAVDHGDTVPLRGEVHTITHEGAPLEVSVSTAAIRRDHARAAGLDPERTPLPTVRQIFDLARSGDVIARDVVAASMRTLGVALGPWLHRFGAEVCVVGGAMARSWDLIEEPLADGVAAGGADVRLRPALLFDEAPLIGAAVWSSRRTA